ncbi:hypothetical protein DFR55_1241 [Herbinix hemicellulosilytica]|uniref:Uncharacterized protein n=1 Tax=Herbinix hemicellulosilytica TaxID=1564487 RepID=A0A0H5SJK3_HERHM|nr:hypothetical protein [Herbinix hemicellulosilytica]RBP57338.1 hypothetical protein DFR55_1241 [Herbinix hemicellulosilytica]CRZ35679.1 hypothetical protein HHT355_2494 [Herbinix hemicellulosilytica]
MKSKISIILFGAGFIIAILGEAYLLNAPKQDFFSIIGIGIVVILTGYLWFDSVWEHISGRYKKTLLLWDEARKLDAKKRDVALTEMLNIQKATYAALKKSINRTEEELKQICTLLKNEKEGQINNRNIPANISYQDSKEIIEAVRGICKGINYEEELKEVITLLQSYQDNFNYK